jgi:hypothetical protein
MVALAMQEEKLKKVTRVTRLHRKIFQFRGLEAASSSQGAGPPPHVCHPERK